MPEGGSHEHGLSGHATYILPAEIVRIRTVRTLTRGHRFPFDTKFNSRCSKTEGLLWPNVRTDEDFKLHNTSQLAIHPRVVDRCA